MGADRPAEHVLQPLQVSQLPVVGDLHARSLPHGFYARLGQGFLSAYWRTFIDSPHAVALAAMEEGELVGVLAGTLENRRHVQWALRHHGPRLALRALAAMLVRPATLVWFLRARLGSYLRRAAAAIRGGDASQVPSGGEPVAVLMHMTVVEHARGRGTGTRLVHAFERQVRARGIDDVRLVTLADERGAAGFYERLGWRRSDLRERDGDLIFSMRKSWP